MELQTTQFLCEKKKTLMSEEIVYIIKFKYEQISLPNTPGPIQPIKSVFTWQ